MTLTKQTSIDQITVFENGVVLYRTVTSIIEDNVKISETFHRTSLIPDQDISDQPEKVQAICLVAWTPEIVSTYKNTI